MTAPTDRAALEAAITLKCWATTEAGMFLIPGDRLELLRAAARAHLATLQKAATVEAIDPDSPASDTDLLRGMVGLVDLLLGRDDVPVAIRHVLLSNHRIVDARAAVGIPAKSRLVWVTIEISFDTITGWHHELTEAAANKLADRWRSTRAGKVYVRPVEVET